MADYRLHYAPDNASLAVRLALEELGAPYATRLVDRAAKAQQGAVYRAVNPAGLIPALETPDGVIFETGAILLWLADRHGRMAPLPGDPARGDFLKWLFFTSNTLHLMLRMSFYPGKFVGDDAAAQAALCATLRAWHAVDMTLPRALHLLDTHVAARGPGPDMLDCYLAPLLRWCALYPAGGTAWFRLADFPALAELAARMEARPSGQAAARAEGLGPTPFTAPRPCDPPEGSAT
ncbi:glutathione S-transferase family protein [Thetidibacter halocola]|uniref:Glutathione S-transferase family protein n=1 Tax=Thetidibacter halocola TaxID=2827239 RepID=A0A8J7WGW4_9RHOB|nr:glutathione S-transferase family protein [Thetidibacter halocola]MBS0126597.1 glutathione S-transferase family protein [Thetidibacter halocola]